MKQNKKLIIFGLLGLVVLGGVVFGYLWIISSSPAKSVKAIEQAIKSKDTVGAEKFIDADLIAQNLWPRWKVLYQVNASPLEIALVGGQENNIKDVVKQAWYEAERGTDNLVAKILNKLFTEELKFKINDEIASLVVVYNDSSKGNVDLNFIFQKSDKIWKLVDVQGLERLLIPTSPEDEFIKQARDATRISDISSLNSAISLYLADGGKLVCTDKIYLSTDGTDAVNGTGWLPIDFTHISAGTPFDKLPKDPTNNITYHYSYKCGSLSYELNTSLESQKYGKNGESDVVSQDGGSNSDAYEVGTSLTLIP